MGGELLFTHTFKHGNNELFVQVFASDFLPLCFVAYTLRVSFRLAVNEVFMRVCLSSYLHQTRIKDGRGV